MVVVLGAFIYLYTVVSQRATCHPFHTIWSCTKASPACFRTQLGSSSSFFPWAFSGSHCYQSSSLAVLLRYVSHHAPYNRNTLGRAVFTRWQDCQVSPDTQQQMHTLIEHISCAGTDRSASPIVIIHPPTHPPHRLSSPTVINQLARSPTPRTA